MNIPIEAVYIIAQVLQCVINRHHGFFQIFFIPLLSGDNLLPVPLVHVDGVEVVQFFVSPNGVHVGIDAVTRLHFILVQSHSLPLCQRLHDFHLTLVHVLNGEIHPALHTVQRIVEARFREYEQRRAHTAKLQPIGKLLLEVVLDLLDGSLGLLQTQNRLIAFRNNYVTHSCFSLSPS